VGRRLLSEGANLDLHLRGNRVLVTGSSRGIGLSIAQAFLAEGAQVCITGRQESTVRRSVESLGGRGATDPVWGVAGDLTQPSSVTDLIERITSTWGALDVLVLNLGSGRSAMGLAIEAAEWERVLHLNLISAMTVLGAAVPLLRAGSAPAVVFVGSIAGLEDIGAPIAYAAAKAALTQAMKSAARTLGPDGIRVNMVAPGNIFVEGGVWNQRLQANEADVRRMLRAEVPLGRLGTPDEVAAMVVFVAARCASFLTGACIAIDGGQTRSH
jgi:3-oxoacyl-[acyl-carrier protein] reductase